MRQLDGYANRGLPHSALDSLKVLRSHPDGVPEQEFHAGTVNRLLREALIHTIERPSPDQQGRKISWAVITRAGRDALTARGL